MPRVTVPATVFGLATMGFMCAVLLNKDHSEYQRRAIAIGCSAVGAGMIWHLSEYPAQADAALRTLTDHGISLVIGVVVGATVAWKFGRRIRSILDAL